MELIDVMLVDSAQVLRVLRELLREGSGVSPSAINKKMGIGQQRVRDSTQHPPSAMTMAQPKYKTLVGNCYFWGSASPLERVRMCPKCTPIALVIEVPYDPLSITMRPPLNYHGYLLGLPEKPLRLANALARRVFSA